MSKFYEETIQGLLEAVAIEKDKVPLVEKPNMLVRTLVVDDKEKIENIE